MELARLDERRTVSGRLADLGAGTASAAPVLALASHLSLVTTEAGLAGLEDGWRKLEKAGAGSQAVFQTYDWVRSWTSTYAIPGSGTELCIIAGYRDDQLTFVWPLMKVACGPLRILRWVSEPLAQYGDVLVADGEHPKTWLTAALALIRRLRNIDAIRLRHVRDDAVAAPFLRETFRDAKLTERAPWLDLTAFSGDAAYEARYNPNQRKRRKKIRKALEERFGPIRFELLEAGSGNDAAMGAAIAEKCKWIEDRGRQNRVLRSCQLFAFLKHLSRARDASVRLVTSRMTAGGTELSWEIGLRFGTSHFGFITSHVTGLTDYSPARLHMDFSQRRALADGMTVFDLMVPHDPHKESWSSSAMATRDYHMPVSTLGWIYGRIYVERLRPLLRTGYYRLPPKILRILKPLVGH
jgi:CelD/BcsL family acetyltransferase involved in cellulose biosynthesis